MSKLKESIEVLRERYLDIQKKLCVLAVKRESVLSSDLCPRFEFDADRTREGQKKIAQLNKDTTTACNQARFIERQSNHALGVQAMLGKDAPDVIRVVIALLASKCVTDVLTGDIRNVGAICNMAAGNVPTDLLAVRESFGQKGVLRPFIHWQYGRTLDEIYDVGLTEISFRLLVGLEPDDEFERVNEARAMAQRMGKWR